MTDARGSGEQTRPDLYFSCAVETDGPVPGPFSLLSIGLTCVASFDGRRIRHRNLRDQTYYALLQPISDLSVPETLARSGHTRGQLVADGRAPVDVMPELAAWVREVSGEEYNPVFVAYSGLAWTFAYWYLVQYGGEPGQAGNSPFGVSSVLDIQTLYVARARVPLGQADPSSVPGYLLPPDVPVHDALDVAVRNGKLFLELMERVRV